MTGGGLPVKGKNSGKTEGAFHVSILEVEGGHNSGGDGTITAA